MPRPAKNQLQKRRQDNGTSWEKEVGQQIRSAGGFTYKLLTGYSGTPFDRINAIRINSTDLFAIPVAIECKSLEGAKLNYSAIRPNEAMGLENFANAGGLSLICCRSSFGIHVIPWAEVKDDICSGLRGSVDLAAWETYTDAVIGIRSIARRLIYED